MARFSFQPLLASAHRVVGRVTRWSWILVGAAMVILPLLPVGATSDDQGPLWVPYLQSWGMGLVLVAVISVTGGRIGLHVTRERWVTWHPSPRIAVPLLAMFLAGAALWAMLDVFAANPHIIDEMAQLFHAQTMAAGLVAAPAPRPPEFFLMTHTFVLAEGWVSQYPPGHPALLAVGLLAGAEWAVNPVLGGVSAALVYLVGRGMYGPKTGMIAAVLWVMSSWVVFMSGTYQSHVSAAAFTLAAWALVMAPRPPRTWHYLLGGAALGCVAAIRPLDAVAAAIPLIAWMVIRRRSRHLPWVAVGGAPAVLGLLLLNWKLFGAPLTFGYSALFGPAHGLGFHVDPYGENYTPTVGFQHLVYALRRMHIYLFEWPVPALLPMAIWAVFGWKRRQADAVMLLGLVATPALYFLYWHSGFYIGPRFYYLMAPWLVIGTARVWRWSMSTAKRLNGPRLNTPVTLGVAAAAIVVWGWVGILPTRYAVYRDGLRTMKLHPERVLAERGVEQAIVLVPESWGTRTIVGLWALDVSRTVVERAYRHVDTCSMYLLLLEARRTELSDSEIEARLQGMIDETTLPISRWEDAPDNSIRLRSAVDLPPPCASALQRDYEGFTTFNNLAWRNDVALESGIIFARDLAERNADLLVRYPGWDVWRWAPPRGQNDALPTLSHLGTAGVADPDASP